MSKLHVTFLPVQRTVVANTGDTLLDVALDNGVPMPHECGGNCACTTCHVRVEAGAGALSGMEDVEAERLATADHCSDRSRLGCQALLMGGDVTVTLLEIR